MIKKYYVSLCLTIFSFAYGVDDSIPRNRALITELPSEILGLVLPQITARDLACFYGTGDKQLRARINQITQKTTDSVIEKAGVEAYRKLPFKEGRASFEEMSDLKLYGLITYFDKLIKYVGCESVLYRRDLTQNFLSIFTKTLKPNVLFILVKIRVPEATRLYYYQLNVDRFNQEKLSLALSFLKNEANEGNQEALDLMLQHDLSWRDSEEYKAIIARQLEDGVPGAFQRQYELLKSRIDDFSDDDSSDDGLDELKSQVKKIALDQIYGQVSGALEFFLSDAAGLCSTRSSILSFMLPKSEVKLSSDEIKVMLKDPRTLGTPKAFQIIWDYYERSQDSAGQKTFLEEQVQQKNQDAIIEKTSQLVNKIMLSNRMYRGDFSLSGEDNLFIDEQVERRIPQAIQFKLHLIDGAFREALKSRLSYSRVETPNPKVNSPEVNYRDFIDYAVKAGYKEAVPLKIKALGNQLGGYSKEQDHKEFIDDQIAKRNPDAIRLKFEGLRDGFFGYSQEGAKKFLEQEVTRKTPGALEFLVSALKGGADGYCTDFKKAGELLSEREELLDQNAIEPMYLHVVSSRRDSKQEARDYLFDIVRRPIAATPGVFDKVNDLLSDNEDRKTWLEFLDNEISQGNLNAIDFKLRLINVSLFDFLEKDIKEFIDNQIVQRNSIATMIKLKILNHLLKVNDTQGQGSNGGGYSLQDDERSFINSLFLQGNNFARSIRLIAIAKSVLGYKDYESEFKKLMKHVIGNV